MTYSVEKLSILNLVCPVLGRFSSCFPPLPLFCGLRWAFGVFECQIGTVVLLNLGGLQIRLAIFRKFWAVAARSSSSLAPLIPRSLRRSSFRIRLRWAKDISTFLRSSRDCLKAGVFFKARTYSRTLSLTSRGTLRHDVLGQQRFFIGQGPQSRVLAR